MEPENVPPTSGRGAWKNSPTGLPVGVPPPSVPLSFLSAAATGLIACGVALVWSRSYAVVDPTNDRVVGAAHFAMLATLSMGVLGAIHQFTPVMTRKPLRSVIISRATFFSWLAGSWSLALGFATQHEPVVEVGGMFAGVAVVLLVVNISSSLAQSGKGAPVTGLRLAIIGFVATACIGAVYVTDRSAKWFDLSGHVVVAHAVVGLLAWLGLTYLSVSEKLWPMFLLAHVPGRQWAAWIGVWALFVGVACLSPGLLWNVEWLSWSGALLVAIGLGAHLVSLIMHVKYRRRTVDLHLVFVVTAGAWLVAGMGLALAGALTVGHHHHLGVALVAAAVSAIAGWLLVALVGHSYKIVPFIVWSALRGRGTSKNADGTPLMFGDLYNHRASIVVYAFVVSGVTATCLGFALSSSLVLALGGLLFVATGLSVIINLSWRPLRLLTSTAKGGSTDQVATSLTLGVTLDRKPSQG